MTAFVLIINEPGRLVYTFAGAIFLYSAIIDIFPPITDQEAIILVQLLAMLTMLIDHLGIVLFPEEPGWRYIGRIAMPLYAYALVIGYRMTRSVPKYMLRLAAIAVLSQLPYQWALIDPLERPDINVVGSLLVCLCVLWLIDRLKHPLLGIIPAIAGCVLLELLHFNYGAYILMLVLIYRYTHSHIAVLLHFVLNLMFIYVGWFTQIFSIFATMILVYAPYILKELDRLPLPRIVWRSFYPVHLAVLAVVRFLI